MSETKDEFKPVVDELKTAMSEYKDAVIKEAKDRSDEVKLELAEQKKEQEAIKASILDIDGKLKNAEASKTKKTLIMSKQEFEVTISDSFHNDLMANKDEVLKLASQKATGILKQKDGSEKFSIQYKAAPAVVTSASLSGVAYNTILDWRPGMEPIGTVHFRDLVRTIQSEFDTVHYPRANTPIGGGSMGKQANEGSLKPQVDRGYTQVDLTLVPYAGYIIVTRQSLRNIPFLSTWLPISMNEQLLDYEDADFSQTLVGAATGLTTGTSGLPGGGINADNLIRIIAQLRKSKYTPTAIATDPAVWANFLTYRASTSGVYTTPIGTVSISDNGTIRFMGIPMYPVPWLVSGRTIVGDWTKAAIVESEGLTWRMSENVNDTFLRNEVAFLLERVEGLAIFRPDAFTTAVFNAS